MEGDVLHELHGVEVPSLGIHPEIMHRHNVRVCQAAEHAGFQLEALAVVLSITFIATVRPSF